MVTVAIVTRRLKEGKTYKDFRRAWFHTVGFGTPGTLYTALNVLDPQEIVVMGFVETDFEHFTEVAGIDVKVRLGSLLDDVIEPEIGRKFGIMVSEDNFSTEGTIGYKPPSIHGKETDLNVFARDLTSIAGIIAEASHKRDQLKKERS